ncbi:MAG TPA: universal stress protein [Edaphocola sp.]|nr:universal stress protein [Edaphocola sp.]
MKTIIVPTDFSRNAHNAAEYAVQMALHFGDKIMLMHAYESPVAISAYEIESTHFESMKHYVEKRLAEQKAGLQEKFGRDILIETVAFNGHLIERISGLYAHPDAKLAVIGLTGAGMANFFLGSNTLGIVNGVGRTVLTVPPYAPFKPVKKIVFAFDLWHVEATLPVQRIKRLMGMLQAELLVLNVVKTNHEDSGDTWKEEKRKLADLMGDIPYAFHTIKSRRIVHGITEFAREQQADLIAIVPRAHGFLEDLLGENHTKALLFHSGIPILTMPPDAVRQ